MSKKILGLDLGITSIGWAVISEIEKKRDILGMGSRIIPISADDKDEFSKGNKITKNQKRTLRRTQRKGYDRYQLRRKSLTQILLENKMHDPSLFKLEADSLWGLRSSAVVRQVSLTELGRIFYHLNQKRGYKSSRSDANLDKKETEYVAEIKNRHQILSEQGITIGQHFYQELKSNPAYRIKQQVYPREAYTEEFDAICRQQSQHYPNVLTPTFIDQLRNEIIYYQRKLKSQKRLVSKCEFEMFESKNKSGKNIYVGPRVAPRSSPLAQVTKIWESINSIALKNRKGEIWQIPLEKKVEIFTYLDNHERLSLSELNKILGLSKSDGWYGNKQLEKGIQGNITKVKILKALGTLPNFEDLIRYSLLVEDTGIEAFLINAKTGEVAQSKPGRIISTSASEQPLYKLWHVIYSISDDEECSKALTSQFNIDHQHAEALSKLDFKVSGFSNKSNKAMRKILPYLMDGYVYSDACSFAGYNHSNFRTTSENEMRALEEKLALLPKNSLRQPVVEKILNQMIQVVNEVMSSYGRPDEIRIELARELKQNQEERNNAFKNMSQRERENDNIRKRLTEEYQTRASRNNVIKWRLFHEISGEESKLNAICIYCGQPFGITDALTGANVDVEHIIPKKLLFDDSQTNKTLSHRRCNENKKDRTAFDYMQSQPDTIFDEYLERIEDLYKRGIIHKSKRDKLLMAADKIPTDFIDRQLRETQYIAKKSKSILESICRNVFSTSGSVTEYLRRIWGWDDVLENLNIPKYRELDQTQWKEWETNDGQVHRREVISGWTKRDDHRHHAIDALVIACTQQGFIQRINNLSAQGNRDEMYAAIGTALKGNLLEKYLSGFKPFDTATVESHASNILISFKSGKKVTTPGKRKIRRNGRFEIIQDQLNIPRGALSEESVYGKIRLIEPNRPLKYLFDNPNDIVDAEIKRQIQDRLQQFDNNPKVALASIKKNPLYKNNDETKPLEVSACFREEVVIKYPIETIKAKDVEYIIDGHIRDLVRQRLENYQNKEKEAFKTPLFSDKAGRQQIRSVRMRTGLSAVEAVKKDEKGKDIGFVKPGNNHHLSFYKTKDGQTVTQGCTFWNAVARKNWIIPTIIKDPKSTWDTIINSGEENWPPSLLASLPEDGWTFLYSIQQNEMFILGMSSEAINEAIQSKDKSLFSNNLYRLQKFSVEGLTNIDVTFRHHLETKLDDSNEARFAKRFHRIKSIKSLMDINPVKVKISILGQISLIQ